MCNKIESEDNEKSLYSNSKNPEYVKIFGNISVKSTPLLTLRIGACQKHQNTPSIPI